MQVKLRGIAATLTVLAAITGFAPAVSAAPVTAPSAAVLTGLALRDPTVMQSFAWDPASRTWVFAQLTSGSPTSSGDLTLTRVSAAGAVTGWMHLTGFGHGVSIGVEPTDSGLFVWTETHAVSEPARGAAELAGSYGNQIARFPWRNSATITSTSADLQRFIPNGGAAGQTPSVDVPDGLIAVRYWSAGLGVFRWAIYNLAEFKKHIYTALARFSVPAALAGNVEQGWTLASRTQVGNWQGTSTGQPGNATFATISTTGTLTGLTNSTVPGEPEGMTRAGPGNLCTGFASGAVGARRANVYCQARL